MAGGLNKAFLAGMRAADPSIYLRGNIFNSQPDLRLQTGLVTISIEIEDGVLTPNQPPTFCQRGLKSWIATNQFKAYWCGNRARASVSVALTDQAEFFFTPALTGCTLEINFPTITHHDEAVPGLAAALAHIADAGPANTVGRRKYTHPDDGGCSIVIGRKTGPGVWQFWRQMYQPGNRVRGLLPAANVSRI